MWVASEIDHLFRSRGCRPSTFKSKPSGLYRDRVVANASDHTIPMIGLDRLPRSLPQG